MFQCCPPAKSFARTALERRFGFSSRRPCIGRLHGLGRPIAETVRPIFNWQLMRPTTLLLLALGGAAAVCLYTPDAQGHVVVPSGVTSIADWGFFGCTSLVSIDLPDGLTHIGYGAFYSCTSLFTIGLPDSLTSISGQAFRSCTSLTLVYVPEGCSVGPVAFDNTAVDPGYTYGRAPPPPPSTPPFPPPAEPPCYENCGKPASPPGSPPPLAPPLPPQGPPLSPPPPSPPPAPPPPPSPPPPSPPPAAPPPPSPPPSPPPPSPPTSPPSPPYAPPPSAPWMVESEIIVSGVPCGDASVEACEEYNREISWQLTCVKDEHLEDRTNITGTL